MGVIDLILYTSTRMLRETFMPRDDLQSLMLLRRFVAVAHHIPGRIRLSFTNRVVSALTQGKLAALESLCHPQGCLQNWSFNAATGSLVLEYRANALSPGLLTQLFGSDDQKAQQALTQIQALIADDPMSSEDRYEY